MSRLYATRDEVFRILEAINSAAEDMGLEIVCGADLKVTNYSQRRAYRVSEGHAVMGTRLDITKLILRRRVEDSDSPELSPAEEFVEVKPKKETSTAHADQTHLTLKQLAQRWGISTVFLRREINAGNLSATRFGRNIRVSVEEAQRYVDTRPMQ